MPKWLWTLRDIGFSFVIVQMFAIFTMIMVSIVISMENMDIRSLLLIDVGCLSLWVLFWTVRGCFALVPYINKRNVGE